MLEAKNKISQFEENRIYQENQISSLQEILAQKEKDFKYKVAGINIESKLQEDKLAEYIFKIQEHNDIIKNNRKLCLESPYQLSVTFDKICQTNLLKSESVFNLSVPKSITYGFHILGKNESPVTSIESNLDRDIKASYEQFYSVRNSLFEKGVTIETLTNN